MAKVTIVDPHHWIDADGAFPEAGAVRAKAVRVAQCIEYGGPLKHSEGRTTLVPCRFRPGGSACRGFLLVIKQPDDSILAMCDSCQEDEFLIHNWQDMPFADGPRDPVHLDEAITMDDEAPPEPPSYEPDEIDAKLAKALAAMKWNISPRELREVISTSRMPTDVFRHLQKRLPPPPNAQAVEQFVPVLMEAWNHTARPELEGLTPQEKADERAGVRVQAPTRNSLCPCGSGKKYKRCCISKGGIN